MPDPRQAKAPGGYSEGDLSVICGDTPSLPMTAAECVREWCESLPFSVEYHAGREDGYKAAWAEAAAFYAWHSDWRKAFLDAAQFGVDRRARASRSEVAA